MKNNNRIFIILSSIFFFSSCMKSEWFDIKSDKQLAIPSTLKDLQALLDHGGPMNSATPGLGEVASDGHSVSDPSMLNYLKGEKNAYTWSYEQTNDRIIDWANGNTNGSYVRIYYSNIVLDQIAKIARLPETSLQWNNVKGQALFHRAHAFFELAQVFAPPYVPSTAKSSLGIPLRLEADMNTPTTRPTLQETYDQIINDLILAAELLPEHPSFRTRPSKQAVNALLARVFLSMEDYPKAKNYANDCLQSYSTLIDYATLDLSNTENPFIGYNSEIIFYSMMNGYLSLNTSYLLIDPNLFNLYDNNDLRKKTFFIQDPISGRVTYKGTYSSRGFSNCFTGLATDEILLIRAECLAREGKTQESMNDLNTLLRNRWNGPYTDQTATGPEDALQKVLLERRKELLLRGLRWSDLRRLNRDPRFSVTLTRTIENKTYTLEPNSYKYTFRIPDDIISRTGIPQNAGWE